jgi:hypothetical protein
MSARENLLRKSCRAPGDNHFIYVSHRQHSCGKKDFTNDSLLWMRMYLYRPVLGSPHFWQTDKAPPFLKPRLLDRSTIHQRSKLAYRGG